MKALIVKLLGIAGIIADYLFSKQGRLVMTWAAKAVVWIKEAEELKGHTGAQKFEFVYNKVEQALLEAGFIHTNPTSIIRKIVEMAHGAWEAKQ